MNIKELYKKGLIVLGGIMILIAVYLTFNLDMISQSYSNGEGAADGFDNPKDPKNDKTYWTMTYIIQRIIQYGTFFGGISLIGYSLNIETKKKDESI